MKNDCIRTWRGKMEIHIQLCREHGQAIEFAVPLCVVAKESQFRWRFTVDDTAHGLLIVFIQNVRLCGDYIRFDRNRYMLQQRHVEEMLRRLWHFNGRMEHNSKSGNAFAAQVVGIFLLQFQRHFETTERSSIWCGEIGELFVRRFFVRRESPNVRFAEKRRVFGCHSEGACKEKAKAHFMRGVEYCDLTRTHLSLNRSVLLMPLNVKHIPSSVKTSMNKSEQLYGTYCHLHFSITSSNRSATCHRRKLI